MASAIIEFNEGACYVIKIMEKLGMEKGYFVNKLTKSRDIQRIKNMSRHSSEKVKKRRRKLRAIRKGHIDEEKAEDELAYKSGSF